MVECFLEASVVECSDPSLPPPAATRVTASIVSEVMLSVSIIGLQVWLLIEMIYCYRKISAAGEEALRESALVQPSVPQSLFPLHPVTLSVLSLVSCLSAPVLCDRLCFSLSL